MRATVSVQTDRVVAHAPDLLRGLFMEHVHRCIDGGIYEEDSPLSDERGFRADVLNYLRELRPSLLRYPGGNFACAYDWRQGGLPKEQRPRRFNYGTQEVASYRFRTAGHDIDSEATRELVAEFADFPYLDVCTTVDKETRKLILSVINRHETETMETSVQVIGDRVLGGATGHLLTAQSVKTENSFNNPDAVAPVALEQVSVSNDFTYSFPAHFHSILSVQLQIKPTDKD